MTPAVLGSIGVPFSSRGTRSMFSILFPWSILEPTSCFNSLSSSWKRRGREGGRIYPPEYQPLRLCQFPCITCTLRACPDAYAELPAHVPAVTATQHDHSIISTYGLPINAHLHTPHICYSFQLMPPSYPWKSLGKYLSSAVQQFPHQLSQLLEVLPLSLLMWREREGG